MFKTILRTLSALSITTVSLTASMSFAEHPDHTLNLDCNDPANAHTENCRAEVDIESVTTDVWKNSFGSDSVPPSIEPNPTSRSDQFISPEASVDHYEREERVHLQLDINNDGTNTIVGTSIFYMVKNGNARNHYAGIRVGADLGAPITEAFPEAVWKARFKAVGSYNLGVDFQVNEIFDLTVKFIGNSADPEAMGEISGYIQHTGYYGFEIEAQFNNDGVITGTDGITYGRFQNAQAEPTNTIVGNLTGIIGERGALGAFHSDGNSNSIIRGFAGGFRANGFSEDELVTLRKCVLDPFHAQCSEDKFDDLKEARIELCIEGDNASDTNQIECHNAIRKNNCIRDPFQDHCDAQLGDVYDRAQTERINFCRENKLDLLCTEGRVAVIVACDSNHFSANCANEPDSIRARIDFCADANNAGDPKCNHLLSTPNAARLSQSFNFEGLNTENRTNQFLQGTEAELTASKDGLTIEQPTDESSHEGSLNLAVFDGDASNGVSFFKGISGTSVFHYAGIFSSTDLGEPLTSTQPNAYWKGKFQVTGYLPSTDFTLEINFGDTGGAGNTDDGRVGRIQAFVRVRADSTQHFYVDGGFTDKGVITGDVTYGFFTNSNRKRPSSRKIKGEVRGLIGEKGAVAAFISNDAGHLGYAGGFVARQTTQTEKTGIDRICAFNPFNDKCEFGFEVERDAVIARCKDNREQEIADGYCDDNDVRVFISDCEANPFAPKCVALNSFKAKRADMVNRCADPDNENDRAGCSNVTDIIADCNLNPFGVYCDVQAFEQKRTDFPTDCIANGNCDTVQRTPNAATWNSTANPFANVNAANAGGGFVHGTEDNLAGGDGLVPANVTKLNLSTATFGGSDKPLGGEAADGLAFGTDSENKHYAGIFSGTDLGAPIAQTVGRASWVGSASFSRGGLVVLRNTRDFVLEVNFADRKIEADTDVFTITGDFNDNGVISGKAIDNFLSGKPHATLSGLIGEEGAVGVFINENNKFSGGFVARPPNSDQMASLNATCASFANDIFRSHNSVYSANCSLKAAAEIDSLIKKCIMGKNVGIAECNDAALEAADVKATVVACIKNPFGTECGEALDDNHDVARDNRSEFCNNFLNAEHEFCTDDNLALVCGYDPFNAICVGGAHYTKQEEICATDHGSVRCRPTVARVCVGNNDIFNRVCGDDYNPARLGVCRNEYDNGPSVRCTATVTRICTNDVFDDLCKHDAYFDKRVTACRGRDDDPRCTETITTACQRDLFDPFCNTTHSDARRARINLCNNLTGDVPEPNCMGDNLTNLCRYDPFNAVCPSSPSDDNKARAVKLLKMCANSAQADSLGCISILKRPNAATLLQAHPAETLVTTGESNQFLNATKPTDSGKSGLDGLEAAVEAGTVRLLSGDARSLNLSVLNTAGVEGDADDGVGYAVARTVRSNNSLSKYRHFAGIFSSTDLGAPLTQTNTKVGWKGKIQVPGYSLKSEDFTLEITFGNAGEGKVEAFVYDSVDRYFHLKGDFDSKGLITNGTARFGHFANHARNGTITEEINGKLRGLIGQDGAVGAFVSGPSKFFGFGGGFVARPLTAGETTTLIDDTCEGNPFDAKCFGFDVRRNARLVLCQEDGRAAETGCTGGANAVIANCTANPFSEDCTWDAFEETRVTLIDRCYADSTGEGCAVINPVINDCRTNLFGVNCYFEVFNAARQELLKACKDDTSDCTDSIEASMRTQPNAVTWEHVVTTRAENPLVLGDAEGVISSEGQFLKNIEDVQTNTEIKILDTTYRTLDLSTATFNISDTPDGKGTALGGHAEDGLAYFQGRAAGQEYEYSYSGYNWYAGIFSTTDLGAPVIDEEGTASWVGSFTYGSYHDPQDFVLEVNFDTQSIEAFVDNAYSDSLIRGKYNDSGVISGTVTRDEFTDNNRYKPTHRYSRFEATLTGLIGKEGAVGVFFYGGFVARPADLVVDETTNKNAETFLNETCKTDPFHQFCYLRQDARTKRIDECITGNKAGTSGCAGAIEYERCIRYPFDEECKTTFAYHNDTMDKPYYEIARKNRSAFCNDSANETDDFCTGAEQVALCSYDPFNRICDNANGLYNNARQAVCESNPTSSECVAIVDTICDATNGNIYHPSCDADYDATRLADLTTFCESTTNKENNPICANAQVAFCSMHANAENIACAGNLPKKVTTASWLHSLYKDNGLLPPTEPDTVRLRHQFLQGTADGVDNGDVEIRGYDSTGPYYSSFNFNTATFDGLKLGGIATGGAAWFSGNRGSYAGILSGTDLGAPLVETTTGMKFYGQFQMIILLPTDFTLDIDFSEGSTDGSVGTVKASIHYLSTDYFFLDGKFYDNGVISGTVTIGQFENNDRIVSNRIHKSVLTGLIGAEGAVGAFVGREFHGGFVAVPKEVIPVDPNVKYSDWIRSFGNTTSLPTSVGYNEPQQTRFLKGTETGLGTGYTYRDPAPQTLTLADVRTDGEGADGVAYVAWPLSYGSQITRHYAGILSGANLGAVLRTAGADGAITANWKGLLGLIANGSEVALRDIALTVDFDDTSITIVDSKTTANTHFLNFKDLSWDENGVITGKINYNPGAALDNLDVDSADSPGKVTGLIGQQGAVGAFRSIHVDNPTATHTSYAGGFVAVPSDVFSQTVSFSDWVRSFDNTSKLPDHVAYNETKQTRFLQGAEIYSSTSYLANAVRPSPLTLADGDLGGEATDGVAYMFGNQGKDYNYQTESYDTMTKHHYAGILSGTNLGAPLKAVDASGNLIPTATWSGKLGMIVNGASPVEAGIDLTVDYIARTISHNATLTGVGLVNLQSGWNEHGVFTDGTITYTPDSVGATTSSGMLTGLIGQQGAVGAFISNHDNPSSKASYAGGFVAVPPSE